MAEIPAQLSKKESTKNSETEVLEFNEKLPLEHTKRLLELIENQKIEVPTLEILDKFFTENDESLSAKISLDGKTLELSPEQKGLLLKQIQGIDTVTRIPRRGRQNEIIKKEIAHHAENGSLRDQANTMALISFDLRGLKIVNDACGDHTCGDDYLRTIVEIIEDHVSPHIKKFLTDLSPSKKEPTLEIARDGGDEFSLFISGDINLDQELLFDPKQEGEANHIKNMFAEHPELLEILSRKGRPEGLPNNLHALFAEMINETVPRFGTEPPLLSKELIEKHINRGADHVDYIRVPDDYSFRPYVASGSATLSEIITTPEKEDFKSLSDPTNPQQSLSELMGALRSRSDMRSYVQKADQTLAWGEGSEEEKFHAAVTQRTPESTAYVVEIIYLKEELDEMMDRESQFEQKIQELQTQLKETIEKLQTCQESQTRQQIT